MTSETGYPVSVNELEKPLQIVPIPDSNVVEVGTRGKNAMRSLEVNVLRFPKLQDSRIPRNDVESEPTLMTIEERDRFVSDESTDG